MMPYRSSLNTKEKQFEGIVPMFKDKKVLVIGDLMLDVYIRGNSSRLSPEAPVPVVDVTDTEEVLGGAANTACNLAELGATVFACGIVGDDYGGLKIIQLLQRAGVFTDHVTISRGRKTIIKTRVIAGHQTITRFDSGDTTPVGDPDGLRKNQLQKLTENIDAVLISDYDKGTIDGDFLTFLQTVRKTEKVFLAVDSKRISFFKGIHPDLVKPNFSEALHELNIKPIGSSKREQILKHGKKLLSICNAKHVAVTLDSEGAAIFSDESHVYQAAPSISNPHVAGAGDTFLSAITLSLLAGASITSSAKIAIAASSVAITKIHTSFCSNEELIQTLTQRNKRLTLSDVMQRCESERINKKRIILTNGCFDILHSGHVSYLQQAKALGDILIVGLNDDESIKRLKGVSRPFNSLADRVMVLSALSAVDYIVPFGQEFDDTPIALIQAVKPDIFVKGGDYEIADLPEADTVEQCGGDIVILPYLNEYSTTRLAQQIRDQKEETMIDQDGFVS